MTVTTSSNSVVYRGNGATTEFAVPFKVLDEDHLIVRRREYSTGDIDYTYVGTDYSYSGIGASEGTLTLAGAALDDDYELVIERIVPYTQELDIVNAGGFYPETVEVQLDLMTMETQQIASIASRSMLVPVGEEGVTFPKASLRAGMYAAFDANGNPVASVGTGTDTGLRSDLATTGGSLVAYQATGAGTVASTMATKLLELRSLEDFGAVRYDNIPAALAGTDSTEAIQAAIDWASTGGTMARALQVTGFFQCENITLPPAIALLGYSRQTSGFAAKAATAGKWFSAADPQKLVLDGMLFYANDEPNITHVMDLGTTGQHGTEGNIEGCWFRGAPEGTGLYVNGNVSYVRNCVIESCKYGFYGIGAGNKAENITLMQIGQGAGTPAEARALFLSGWQMDRVHIEAPISTSIPISIFRGDSTISNLTLAPAVGSSFPVLIETDNVEYTSWALNNIHVYSPANVTITEAGLLRYGNHDTDTWTYLLGTNAGVLSGFSTQRMVNVREKFMVADQQRQFFSLRIEHVGGAIKHAIGQLADANAAGDGYEKVIGASNVTTATTIGTGGPFTVGAVIDAAGRLILNTAAQVASKQDFGGVISYQTTGAALTLYVGFESTTVNGVVQVRPVLQLRNTSGVTVPFNLLTAGQVVIMQLRGYLA